MHVDARSVMNMLKKIRRWIKGELLLMRYEYDQRCLWIDFVRDFRSATSDYRRLIVYTHYEMAWRDSDFYFLGRVRSEVPYEMRQL